MTRGGPINSTQTVQMVVYTYAFSYFKMGYASAISWLLFGIIFFFSALQNTNRPRAGQFPPHALASPSDNQQPQTGHDQQSQSSWLWHCLSDSNVVVVDCRGVVGKQVNRGDRRVGTPRTRGEQRVIVIDVGKVVVQICFDADFGPSVPYQIDTANSIGVQVEFQLRRPEIGRASCRERV